MKANNRKEPFRKTTLTLTGILLLAALLSLLLPHVLIHGTYISIVFTISGWEFGAIRIPLAFLIVCAVLLIFSKQRRSAIIACAAAAVASPWLLYIYLQTDRLVHYSNSAYPGIRFDARPGIGLIVLAGCSVVLVFIAALAIKHAPSPQKMLRENGPIDEPIGE